MNHQTIGEFWNLSGVLGVAIIERQSEPYFYVKEQILPWEKQVLNQIILQNIAKNSDKLEFFEFPIMGYYAYAYKLNSKFNFLILTQNNAVVFNLQTINQLKAALQEDMKNAITILRSLTEKTPTSRAVSTIKTATVLPQASVNTSLEVKVTIEELLNALNQLSKYSSNYIGTKLTADYWQQTRPKFPWIENFTIERSGKIIFSGVITQSVSTLQHQLVKEWTAAFIKQSSKIIQNLPMMVEQVGLDEQKKRILLTPPVG